MEKKLYKSEPEAKEIIDLAKKIEGCVRHISVHAAGVVIAPEPLPHFVPLQFDPKGGKIITQYDMHAVEDAGLVEMDMGLHEARRDEPSGEIDRLALGRQVRLDGRDPAVRDADVHAAPGIAGQSGVLQDQVHGWAPQALLGRCQEAAVAPPR